MVAVNYLWNPINDNIVREFDDAGSRIAEYTTESDLYGNVVSQFRNGQTSYLLSDGQGNTTELTNDAGTVVDTIRYSAFGEVAQRAGTTEIPFQFVGLKGYYLDEQTGECSVRQRPLNVANGRWLSADVSALTVLWTHHYCYVLNRPTLLHDPSGLAAADDTRTGGIGVPSLVKAQCNVACQGKTIGVVESSIIKYHKGGIVVTDSKMANGISFAVWFTANADGGPTVKPCCCQKYEIIQWVVASVEIDKNRPKGIYVDRDFGSDKPWYGGYYKHGRHQVPPGVPPHSSDLFPGAGKTIDSTVAIYDAPAFFFPSGSPDTVRFNFFTCVVCIRKQPPDRILGQCVYNSYSATKGKGVTAATPICTGGAGTLLLDALTNDPGIDYDEGEEFVRDP